MILWALWPVIRMIAIVLFTVGKWYFLLYLVMVAVDLCAMPTQQLVWMFLAYQNILRAVGNTMRRNWTNASFRSVKCEAGARLQFSW